MTLAEICEVAKSMEESLGSIGTVLRKLSLKRKFLHIKRNE